MDLNLQDIDFSLMPDEYKAELIELLEKREEWMKYNKLSSFCPYEFQIKFYNASKEYKRRFLCAANR